MKTAESFGLTISESDSFNKNESLLEYDDTGEIQDFRSRDCMQVDPVIASIARKKRDKIPLNREEAELYAKIPKSEYFWQNICYQCGIDDLV